MSVLKSKTAGIDNLIVNIQGLLDSDEQLLAAVQAGMSFLALTSFRLYEFKFKLSGGRLELAHAWPLTSIEGIRVQKSASNTKLLFKAHFDFFLTVNGQSERAFGRLVSDQVTASFEELFLQTKTAATNSSPLSQEIIDAAKHFDFLGKRPFFPPKPSASYPTLSDTNKPKKSEAKDIREDGRSAGPRILDF